MAGPRVVIIAEYLSFFPYQRFNRVVGQAYKRLPPWRAVAVINFHNGALAKAYRLKE